MNESIKAVASVIGLALFLGNLSGLRSKGDVIVAPNENLSVHGPGAGNFFQSRQTRFQLVYDGSEFLEAMPLGGFINEVAFRLNETETTPVSGTLGNIEIRMSTSRGPGTSLSLIYDDNVGSDQAVVLPPSSVPFSAGISPFGRPHPFDVKIKLARSFPYDPKAGSLLLDFVVNTPANRAVILDNADMDSSGIVGTAALDSAMRYMGAPVIELDFEPVPEPAAGLLFLMGALGLIFLRRKENHEN